MKSKVAFGLVAIVVALAGVLARHLHHQSTGPLAHARTEFSFTIAADRQTAFPLFGASGERKWGTNEHGNSWNPHFIWPRQEHDVEGEVFTIMHKHTATWINTAFDPVAGHAGYVYVVPDGLVTRIDVRLSELQPGTTQADVVYETTALTPHANAYVEQQANRGPAMAQEWQSEVTAALAR